MRVGVISDTHGLLRPQALDALADADHILHAGDVGEPVILQKLAALAPLTAVRGNVDHGAWCEELPLRQLVELGGLTVYLLHDLADLDLDPAAAGVQVVVSGHSHRPTVQASRGVLYLNPGSAGPRRFHLPVTVAWLETTAEGPRARIVELEL